MGSSGVKADALSQYGTNRNTAATTLGQVNPVYANFLNGNGGYTPQQEASMYTAAAQSAGGGQAAATGAGDLIAARDNNVGGLGTAIADSARVAGDRNAATALGIENRGVDLANQREDDALRALTSIYFNSNGQANANLSTANQAQRPFWQQLALQGTASAGQVASAYAGA